jgi:O-succinylbenzoate synthase
VEKLETTAGRMPVPQGPGIGVTLDHDYLATVSSAPESFSA